MMRLAKMTRRLRTKGGLSLRQCAKRCHISPAYLSQIENGKRHPSCKTISALAHQLCLINGVTEIAEHNSCCARLYLLDMEDRQEEMQTQAETVAKEIMR